MVAENNLKLNKNLIIFVPGNVNMFGGTEKQIRIELEFVNLAGKNLSGLI